MIFEHLMSIWEVLKKVDWWSVASIAIASSALIISARAHRLAERQAASADSRALNNILLSAQTKLSETEIHISDSVSLVRVYEIEHTMVERLRKKAVLAGLSISLKEKEVDSQRYNNAINSARNLYNELSKELNAKHVWTQEQASVLLKKCEEARSLAALAASSLRTTNADVGRLRKDFGEQLDKLYSDRKNT